jgi:hypothetical protein
MVTFHAAFWQTDEGLWVAKIVSVSGEFDLIYWNMIKLATAMTPELEGLEQATRDMITNLLDYVPGGFDVTLGYLTRVTPDMMLTVRKSVVEES